MNYLELCQRLVQKAGISGTLVSVNGQAGELLRAVGWIAEAYEYIQLKHPDWEFLRRDLAFPAAIGKNRYTPSEANVTDFGEWRFASSWRCYNTAAGVIDEQPIAYMPYDRFRDECMYSNTRLMTGRPSVITQAPDQSVILWPTPAEPYTVVGEYFRAPAIMVRNDDTPIFAARFHSILVHRALMFYGEYEGDPNTFGVGQTECARFLDMLEDAYLPNEWQNAGAMA